MSRVDQPPSSPLTGQPRRAEESDTRQGIQRHDPEFYKKKKDEGEEPGFKDPYEDLAEVSVPALRNFLMGLIDRPAAPPVPAAAPSAPHHPPTAQQAAASAYQKRSGPAAYTPPPASVSTPATETQPTALDQAAAALDRSEVLELIRDLDRLTAAGIEIIALEKADGFLASIRGGINRALQS